MRADYGKRLSSIRSLASSSGLSATLIGNRADVLYYTGRRLSQSDPAFLLIPPKGRPTLFVSSLNNEVKGSGSISVKDLKSVKPSLSRFKKIGFDERSMTMFTFRRLKKAGQKWKPFCETIRKPMLIKDGSEMESIRKATSVNLKCFSTRALEGRTEAEAAAEIEKKMREHGCEPSFEPIVASGTNSGFIHHLPATKKIGQGLCIVDCGVKFDGYCSDLTRTFLFSGNLWHKKLWSDIESIQGELIDFIKPGVRHSDVQKRYESLMQKCGYKVAHLFGHGVGLNVHEGPSGDDVLEPGMVLTVEPGAYFEKKGGCRIEDMVLVTKTGRKVLSR